MALYLNTTKTNRSGAAPEHQVLPSDDDPEAICPARAIHQMTAQDPAYMPDAATPLSAAPPHASSAILKERDVAGLGRTQMGCTG